MPRLFLTLLALLFALGCSRTRTAQAQIVYPTAYSVLTESFENYSDAAWLAQLEVVTAESVGKPFEWSRDFTYPVSPTEAQVDLRYRGCDLVLVNFRRQDGQQLHAPLILQEKGNRSVKWRTPAGSVSRFTMQVEATRAQRCEVELLYFGVR